MMPSCEDQLVVAWFSSVPEDVRTKAVCAASHVGEALGRKMGPGKNVMILLMPIEAFGAMVMHKDERIVPQQVKDFAESCGARYVIAVAAGLFGWEPELAEAVLAHEFGHIALGHCDGRVTRCLSQFGLFRKLCLGYELAADAFAARLGYGEALAEALRRFRAASRTPFGGLRTAVRLRNLHRILKCPGLVPGVCIRESRPEETHG